MVKKVMFLHTEISKCYIIKHASSYISTYVNNKPIIFPFSEEERAMRRVSYLKATWGDRLHLDSDVEPEIDNALRRYLSDTFYITEHFSSKNPYSCSEICCCESCHSPLGSR